MARAQLDSHSVPGKWVCEEENIFSFDCLSPCHFATSALCFLTFPPLYLPPFSFCLSIIYVFPFFSPPTHSSLLLTPHHQIFLFSFVSPFFRSFHFAVLLPQFSAARRLRHAATSMAETIASVTGEAGGGNVNVKPFDATS